jgi:hypothetical protein
MTWYRWTLKVEGPWVNLNLDEGESYGEEIYVPSWRGVKKCIRSARRLPGNLGSPNVTLSISRLTHRG